MYTCEPKHHLRNAPVIQIEKYIADLTQNNPIYSNVSKLSPVAGNYALIEDLTFKITILHDFSKKSMGIFLLRVLNYKGNSSDDIWI